MSILEDRQLNFHGVGQNLLKYISILENGIVTKNDSNNIKGYTKNYGGYNTDNMISTVMSPSINGTYTYGAFGTYIVGGIGFVLKDSKGIRAKGSMFDSGFIDEEFHQGSIDKQKIVGIIIDKELLNKKVSELRILTHMGTGYVDNTCVSILDFLRKNGEKEIDFTVIDNFIIEKAEIEKDSTLDYLDKSKLRDNIIEKMDIKMGEYIESYFNQVLGIDDINVKNVIDFYNKNKLPLYDEKGNLIDQRYMFAYELKTKSSNEICKDKDIKLQVCDKKQYDTNIELDI